MGQGPGYLGCWILQFLCLMQFCNAHALKLAKKI